MTAFAAPIAAQIWDMKYRLKEADGTPVDITVEDTWRRIQTRIPGTEFNFDFWTHNQPRRATYPACRAVLAAERLQSGRGDDMLLAIQRAYYTRALNPSDDAILIALATELGLDGDRFKPLLASPEVAADLAMERQLTQSLGVSSFPSLVLDVDGSRWPIAVDYTDADSMIDEIGFILDDD